MDDNETPLAKYCTGEMCYLQVSTSAVEADGEFSIVATTPHGGRDVTTDGDGLVVVKRSTARRYQELKLEEELVELDDDVTESGIAREQQGEKGDDDNEEGSLGKEGGTDDSCSCNSGDFTAEADSGCEVGENSGDDMEQSVGTDVDNSKDDESETPDSEPSDADQGNDSANNGDDSDNGNSSDNYDDSSNAEVSGGEACVDGGDDTDNCDGGQKVAPDSGDDGECGSDASPNVNNTPNDKVTNEVDLLGDVGSGAQV